MLSQLPLPLLPRGAAEIAPGVGLLAGEDGGLVDKLWWHAAALGMTGRAEELLGSDPPPTQEEIDHAFWQACHGGQRRMAEFLLARGADINAIPDHTKHTPLDIAPGPGTRREAVVSWLREHGARSAKDSPTGKT